MNDTVSMKDLLTFAEAAKLCPGEPSASALSRWRREGIKTRSGERVHLECGRSGKQFFTSEIWLMQFFNRVAELDQFAPPPKPFRITSDRNAHDILVEAGILK